MSEAKSNLKIFNTDIYSQKKFKIQKALESEMFQLMSKAYPSKSSNNLEIKKASDVMKIKEFECFKNHQSF